jgi:hypothetical protein
MFDFMVFITRALGLTVALSWTRATTHMMDYIFPPADGNSAVRNAIAYAVITTIAVVLIMILINHIRKDQYEHGACRVPHEDIISRDSHDDATSYVIPAMELWRPPCATGRARARKTDAEP